MFIFGYHKPSNYQQHGSLRTKIIAVGHKLLFKEPFCFVDFTNEVFIHNLLRCRFQTRPPSPYHRQVVLAYHQITSSSSDPSRAFEIPHVLNDFLTISAGISAHDCFTHLRNRFLDSAFIFTAGVNSKGPVIIQERY